MVLPWVKLGALSLNACTSATVGGVCTYCIFGGENKEERKNIDEIYLQIGKIKKDFESEEKVLKANEEKALEAAKATVVNLERIEGCLNQKREVYEETIKNLWKKWFEKVKFWGEYCK